MFKVHKILTMHVYYYIEKNRTIQNRNIQIKGRESSWFTSNLMQKVLNQVLQK